MGAQPARGTHPLEGIFRECTRASAPAASDGATAFVSALGHSLARPRSTQPFVGALRSPYDPVRAGFVRRQTNSPATSRGPGCAASANVTGSLPVGRTACPWGRGAGAGHGQGAPITAAVRQQRRAVGVRPASRSRPGPRIDSAPKIFPGPGDARYPAETLGSLETAHPEAEDIGRQRVADHAVEGPEARCPSRDSYSAIPDQWPARRRGSACPPRSDPRSDE